jgi:hypothetical protein
LEFNAWLDAFSLTVGDLELVHASESEAGRGSEP